MTKELNEKELLDLIKSGKIVVVKTWMPNCSFCEKYEPIFDKVSKEYEGIDFVSFNMTVSASATSEFKKLYMSPGRGEKLSAPCTHVFEGGQMLQRHFGLIDEEQLKNLIAGKSIMSKEQEAVALEYAQVLARRGELSYLIDMYQREMPGLDNRISELRKIMGIAK